MKGLSKEIFVEQLRLSQYSGKPGESKFKGWIRQSVKLFGKHLQAENGNKENLTLV